MKADQACLGGEGRRGGLYVAQVKVVFPYDAGQVIWKEYFTIIRSFSQTWWLNF